MAWSIAHAALLGVHVACMTFWMGSMIFGLVLGGAGRVQAALLANPATAGLVARLPLAYGLAIPTGVLSGVLMGTVFGPVQTVAAFLTPYGITMAFALLLVMMAGATGRPSADRQPGWASRWHLGEAGIFGAFACMMLMRFGL